MISRWRWISFLFLGSYLLTCCQPQAPAVDPVFHPEMFNAERAYQDVLSQVEIGPRYSGSQGHVEMRKWLVGTLKEAGWQPTVLEASFADLPIYNIEACRNAEPRLADGYLILGAHYDTRMYADSDPDLAQRNAPVPGANDGASGVAVLLEIARVLPEEYQQPICLVFFDAEDNGRILPWDWAVGSRAFVAQLEAYPSAVVIVDMVGDTDQHFPIEKNSDPALAAEIWEVAATLGIDSFSVEAGYAILDDHTAFIQKEIPAVDIIDFDYPFWHTTADTADKVLPASLKNVGDVLLAWLLGK